MTNFRILSNNQWKAERNFEAWAEKGLDSSPAARAPGFARMFAELDADIIVGDLLTTVEYDYPAFHLSMDCFWAMLADGAKIKL